MRNMSFALTTAQILNRSKTVTRRSGWKTLQPGTLIQAVKKGIGLKPGQKVEKLAVLRVLSVRREPLRRLVEDFTYGLAEVAREGFTDHPSVKGSPDCFVDFYRNAHHASDRPTLDDDVTRIEFEYVEAR
jgi:hypothetical protein